MKILKKVVLTGVLATITVCTMNVAVNAATVKATGETVNIRKGPSTDTKVVAKISEGVECELLEEEGDWYKVKFRNYTGYISKEYSKLLEDKSTNNDKKQNDDEETKKEENNKNNNDESKNENKENESTPTEQTSNESNDIKEEQTIIYKKFRQDTQIRILPLIHSSKIGDIKKDTKVVFITELSGWTYIQSDSISGWVRTSTLSEEKIESKNDTDKSNSDNTEKSDETEKSEKIGYVNENQVNMRKGAGKNYSVVKTLTLNTKVTILEEEGGWYKIKAGDKTGYIAKNYISNSKKVTSRSSSTPRDEDSLENNTENDETKNEKSSSSTDSEKKEETTNINNESQKVVSEEKNDTSKNSTSKTDKKQESSTKQKNDTIKTTDVIAYAKKYLGHQYVYGADGSNGTFDCSGFTMYVYKHFGISLPHKASSQYTCGKGTQIKKQSQLKQGDIVFLTNYGTGKGIGHCGIYIGNGNFIHASTTSYTVTISNLNTIYKGRFCGGLRLIK